MESGYKGQLSSFRNNQTHTIVNSFKETHFYNNILSDILYPFLVPKPFILLLKTMSVVSYEGSLLGCL